MHGIYIPIEPEEQLKSLLRQRNQVVKQLRKAKSPVNGLLVFHGIAIPERFDNPNWSHDFVGWLKTIQWAHITGTACINSKP